MIYGERYGGFYGDSGTKMTPTKQRDIRDVFIREIKAISPSYYEYQDSTWVPVHTREDARGGELRNFFVQFQAGHPDFPGGPAGGGVPHEAECRVYVAYGGLADDHKEIIDDDGRQVWMALENTRGEPSGYWDLHYNGWEEENDEPGHIYGYFSFTVRYLTQDTA